MNMKRNLWGEFQDGSGKRQETKKDDIILPSEKVEKLKKVKEAIKEVEDKVSKVEFENPIVTQTVEVMNQSEMIQSLIDTYASKTGFNNYLINPCQMIPHIDFPPENTADVVNEDKFAKPFWFIPPIQTDFSRGRPKSTIKINKEIVMSTLKKSICGLLRVAGFSDASRNALTMFVDAVDEFIKCFLEQIRYVQVNETKDKQNALDIMIIEKAYYGLAHSSLITVHDYFKNDIIARNRTEINEFHEIYNEYEKLMKESQSMQKVQFKEDDYMSLFSFPTPTPQAGVNIINLLETDNHNNMKDIFEGDIMETTPQEEQIQYSTGPPSMEINRMEV